MAKQGLTFDNAFSNGAVCSVARTTLATMCYGPRIGTQFHRRYQLAPMPDGLEMFPAYLRKAGYYTTNNSKKDYNAIEGKGVWDVSSNRASWRNRPDRSQPFFYMESHGQSHESSLHFSRAVYENEKTLTDPMSIQLADCFPDTPLFRYTHARYHDKMQVIDGIVGRTIGKLKEDGLLEDTFVFYFGDHGGVLPRGKGYAYESGLHVPLVVRIPANFKHLAIAPRGDRIEGAVEFVDFGATTLQLAGVKLPNGIDGKPFLGEGVTKESVDARQESFGYADRFDEKYDLVRSIRVGDFHYIRCYQPYLPDGLMNIYRYKMLAYQEWRKLFDAGELQSPQDQFFKAKPVEMLFHVKSDPYEVRNLAGEPGHNETLRKLRVKLNERLKAMPDLSFFPESHLVQQALKNPVEFGRQNKGRIGDLIELSDLQLLPFAKARPGIEAALQSNDTMKRYWGLMVCLAFGEKAKALVPAAKSRLDDNEWIVQVRAAEFLGLLGEINPQEKLISIVNQTDDSVLAVEALNSIVWFKDFFGDRYPVERSDFEPKVRGGDVDDRLNYINGIPYPPKKRSNGKGKKKKQKKQSAKANVQ